MPENGTSAKHLSLLAATALAGAAVAVGISACGGSSPTAETAPVTGLTVPGGGSGAAVKPAPTTASTTTSSTDSSSGGASPGGDSSGSDGSGGGSDSGSGSGGSSSGGSTPAPSGGASPG
ncbi:MAG: hypothetical protein NTY57_05275 [Solirubrobacterales bacterium]|nr:hypothetical protein [Solirubrobacterales bacterium]